MGEESESGWMMLANMRSAFLVLVFSTIAGAGSLVWADHGHGGGHDGGGWGHSSGHSFSGSAFSGGRSHVSLGHFDGHSGFNHFGGGNFDSRHNFRSWPFSFYYQPYAYRYGGYPYWYGNYGYPSYYDYPSYYGYSYPSYDYSYPSDYDVYGNDYDYGDAPPPAYVVGRPVADVARLEVRLPDPQATVWAEGKEITSSGTVRQFRSPPLDPSQRYTYTVKAQWRDNSGKLFEEERQVRVQANARAVVDFTHPIQPAPDTRRPASPELPPPQPQSVDI